MLFIYLFIQKPDSLLSEQETNSDKSVVKRLSLHVRGDRGGLLEKDGAIVSGASPKSRDSKRNLEHGPPQSLASSPG